MVDVSREVLDVSSWKGVKIITRANVEDWIHKSHSENLRIDKKLVRPVKFPSSRKETHVKHVDHSCDRRRRQSCCCGRSKWGNQDYHCCCSGKNLSGFCIIDKTDLVNWRSDSNPNQSSSLLGLYYPFRHTIFSRVSIEEVNSAFDFAIFTFHLIKCIPFSFGISKIQSYLYSLFRLCWEFYTWVKMSRKL